MATGGSLERRYEDEVPGEIRLMLNAMRSRPGRASAMILLVLSAAYLAGCSTSSQKLASSKKRSKEYFAESVYGVKASPRVTNKRSNLKRGGGRDQTGKPYKVRGKWYYPKEQPGYSKIGAASWYGDAFHGRLTANGEIYDMTNLTGAHPTMPLPSYARVTNMKNGNSVIVRVNDRGPYSHGRVVDLSRRAAEMLDYANAGTARVKVDYIGRAPLEGRDDRYLMASYRPGNKAPDPSDGLPEGVMIAMNGPTPGEGELDSGASLPGVMRDPAAATSPRAAPQAPVAVATVRRPRPAAAVAGNATGGLPADIPFEVQDESVEPVFSLDDMALPQDAPIAPERPGLEGEGELTLGYAPSEKRAASAAFSAFSIDEAAQAAPTKAVEEPYIAAGAFDEAAEAERVARELSSFGRVALEREVIDGATYFSISLYGDGRHSLDEMLEAAWSHGAPEAISVRD